jgi:amidophosphoribosyltransferase
MGDFVAFNAAVELMKKRGNENCLKNIYEQCKEMQRNNQLHTCNMVRQVYKPFTNQEITNKIAQLVTPSDVSVPVDVIFQSIESLHEACPNNLGDWYFTGNYPTQGGNRVVNQSFINYMEGKNTRGY